MLGFLLILILYLSFLIGVNIRKGSGERTVSVLSRIMTNYIQIITSALSFNLSYPKYMLAVFSPVTRIESSSSSFLSFDCLF